MTKKREKYGERPHTWLTGPDEYKHNMYVPWMKMKAQANFRGEEWDLDFEDYYNAWHGKWDQRGRSSEQLCMTRKAYDEAWSKDNIEIITRKEHCSKQKQWKYNFDAGQFEPNKKGGRPRRKPAEDAAPKRTYNKNKEIVYKKMKQEP